MEHKVFLSIVIPIYNSEKYLEKCLASVRSQTYTYFEVLLINDGSTDNSLAICEQFTYDKRFKVFNQKNAGVSAARNKGIEESAGEYVAFVDSDDFLAPDYLENLVSLAGKPEVIVSGIYYHNEYKIRRKNQTIEILPFSDVKKKEHVEDKNKYLLELSKRIPQPCFGAPYGKLYKKDLLKEYEIEFELKENLAEDLVFNLKVLQCANDIVVKNHAGYYYRMFVASSLSRIKHSFEYTKKRWQIVNDEYQKLMKKYEIPNKNDRLYAVIYQNLKLSLIQSKGLKVNEKRELLKEAFKQYNPRVKEESVYTFVKSTWKVFISDILRKIYRVLQYKIYELRGGK